MIDQELRTLLSTISTYLTLLPVLLGVLLFRYTDKGDRLILIYLFAGFLIDFSVMMLKDTHRQVAWIIFNSYSLLEPFFLIVYFYLIAPKPWIKKTCYWFLWALVPLWLFFHIEILSDVTVVGKLSGGFAAGYQVIFAFLSAYTLLLFTQEREDMIRAPKFWFVVSIFLCCFCTFFLSSFLESEYRKKIWIVYTFINMLSYLISAYGFSLTRHRANHAMQAV